MQRPIHALSHTLCSLLLIFGVLPLPAFGLDTDALDAYLRRSVEDGYIPGLVAVVTDGKNLIYANAFGAQDVENGIPMSVDSVFRIASMTKPVTSLAVMMLVEAGLVSLDDRVSEYFPEFENRPVIDAFNPEDDTYTTRPAAREITVRHLQTHTSGLAYTFSSPLLARLSSRNSARSSAALPLLHDPGTRWAYSESTRVLGRLVEKVSGMGLEDFFRERIFEPLGMTETGYTVPASLLSRVVTVHRMTPDGLVEVPNGDSVSSPANGDGGLNSTARDYAKFVDLFLNGGVSPDGTRLISRDTVESMSRSHTGNVPVSLQPGVNPLVSRPFPLGAQRDGFGLGFQITAEHADRTTRRPGSMSWAGALNTQFWIDPDAGLGGVLMMQYSPFYDAAAIETLQGFERLIYTSLE
jgi:methyl acetate hydrolase